MGEALGRAFAIWGTNLVPFSLLALMLYWPLGLANYWCHSQIAERIAQRDGDAHEGGLMERALYQPELSGGMELLDGTLTLIEATLMNYLLIGTLTVLVVRRLQDRPVDLVTGLKEGVRSIPRILVVSLVIAVAVGLPIGITVLLTFVHALLGLLMLVALIYAVVLSVKWFVAVPVAVIERPGVLTCLGRSAYLVRSRGWAIFWMMMLVFLIIAIGFDSYLQKLRGR